MTPTKIQRAWCAMLAKMVAPMDASAACAAFIDMLPMLPPEDAAYNCTTLERAARREPGDTAIPNYDRLARSFGQWRRDNLPAHVRMGGSMTVKQVIEQRVPPTPEEIVEVRAKAAAIRSETRNDPKTAARVEPKFVDKLTLARMASPEVLACRPDLRAALDAAGERP